jgi:hypothetical protein
VIRADWTPLWAADSSCRKSLGGKQAACLGFLRKYGALTHAELRQRGIGLSTLNSLYSCYPALMRHDTGHPQRYYLAAPAQQADLEKALAIVAAHPDGITWAGVFDQLPSPLWSGAVLYHLANSGLARYKRSVFYPAQPGEQQALISPAARLTARAMMVRWTVKGAAA